jgi:hypothetical protein
MFNVKYAELNGRRRRWFEREVQNLKKLLEEQQNGL